MHHLRTDPTTGLAEVQERRRRALAYRDALERLRVRGEADGAAVVLGHTGAVLDLSLDAGLAGAPAGRSRSALLRANGLAQRRLEERVAELTAEAFGVDSATTREVVRHYAAVLRPAVEPVPAAATSASGVLR